MGLIDALHEERKRLEAELAKVNKAIQMFNGKGSVSGARRGNRSLLARAVSKAAQDLRWTKKRKESAAAIAKAERELKSAQEKLAASKK